MKHLKHFQLVFTLLVLFCSINKNGCSTLVWERDPDLDGRLLLDEIQVLAVGRVACATACTQRSDCVSFVYDGSKTKCWLFDKIYSATGISTALSSPYVQYYQSTKVPLRPAYCPDSYIYSKPICFNMEVYDVSWLTARQVCLSDGGNLLVPDSERKNKIISQYLNRDIVYYMGIHYIRRFDIFEAVDGRTPSQINYTNWAPGSLDTFLENDLCGALRAFCFVQ